MYKYIYYFAVIMLFDAQIILSLASENPSKVGSLVV